MSEETRFPDAFVERLEILWGEGFLSPGGGEEVARIVRGLDLAGARVLDFGCGLGGPAIVLARDLGAFVTGVDLEPGLLVRAERLIEAAGVADRVALRRIEPGALPFADESFDVVFSKDVFVYVADKSALHADLLRILVPGGVLAASDWLCAEGAGDDPDFQRFVTGSRQAFAMANAAETVAAMTAAGFEAVTVDDRNAWFADCTARELAAIEGPLKPRLVAHSGIETFEKMRRAQRHMLQVTRAGHLRPSHARGRRPRA